MARSRRAIPANTPDQEAQRAENRSHGRHAAPAHQPEHAADGPVERLYHVLSRRGVFGHPQGAVASLKLTDGQASALMAAGHIAPADTPVAPVAAYAAPPAPEESEETGTTPEDNNDADTNSAE
jgi:hypothetical protein